MGSVFLPTSGSKSVLEARESAFRDGTRNRMTKGAVRARAYRLHAALKNEIKKQFVKNWFEFFVSIASFF